MFVMARSAWYLLADQPPAFLESFVNVIESIKGDTMTVFDNETSDQFTAKPTPIKKTEQAYHPRLVFYKKTCRFQTIPFETNWRIMVSH